jgi:hypothetical protein
MRDDINNIRQLHDVWSALPSTVQDLVARVARSVTDDVERSIPLAEVAAFENALHASNVNINSSVLIRHDPEGGRFASEIAYLYVMAYAASNELVELWPSRSALTSKMKALSGAMNASSRRDALTIMVMVLHNDYDRSACELLRDIAIDNESPDFWRFLSAFRDALPYLRITAGDVIPALLAIENRSRGDLAYGMIYGAMENYAQHNPHQAWELYHSLIANPENTTVHFAASVLIGIARSGALNVAFSAALDLTRSENVDLRRNGVAAIAGFAYEEADAQAATEANAMLIKLGLARMNELRQERDTDVGEQLVRGYFNLMRYNDNAIDSLLDLSTWPIPVVQYRMAHELSILPAEHHTEQWFGDCLLSLTTVATDYHGIVETIDSCLDHIRDGNRDLVFTFLVRWIESRSMEDTEGVKVYKLFDMLFASLRQNDVASIEWIITGWFNSDDIRFHHAAAHIVRKCSQIDSPFRLALSADVLKDLSDNDRRFILYKILGYVADGRALATLTFSLIQHDGVSVTIANEVLEAFRAHIYYNYRETTRTFLEANKRSGSRVQRTVAKKLLNQITAFEKRSQEIGRLVEFMPPLSRGMYYYHVKERRQQSAIHKGAAEASVFMRMTHTIPVKGGTSWIVPSSDGFHRSPFTTLSVSAELPMGTALDPIGTHMRMIHWRNLKRGGEE